MSSLKAHFYKVLQDDAKLSSEGTLGYLLNHRSTAPYGVYYETPPEMPQFPLVTYAFGLQSGYMERRIYATVSAWGTSHEEVLERIYDLLHKKVSSLVGADDYRCLGLTFNNGELARFDARFNVWCETQSYTLYVVRR